MFLMRLVTDQLSVGVQHNYVSFCISTYLRIRKNYGDETKQTVTIPSLPELILSEEKVLFRQNFALEHESLINARVYSEQMGLNIICL